MDQKRVDGMIGCGGVATRPPHNILRNPDNPSIFRGNMKRSASELDLEEFLRPTMSPEILTADDNESLEEERIEKVQVQRAKVCGDEEEAYGFFDGVHKTFEDVCAGDLSFGFRDHQNPLMNSFSTCGGVTDNFVWSQNLTPKQSSISATMDSQSSICGPTSSGLTFGYTGTVSAGSPTSIHKPKNGDNQAQGATSGSSREQSDDEDFEAGTCDQSTGSIDMKRLRRMQSNRESARKSRRKKQEQLADLELQVDQLKGENSALYKQFSNANQQFKDAETDNRVFKSDVEALRVKVKLAEDMVARGTLAYSLNNVLLNRSVSPQPLSSNNLSCISEISPTLGIGSDISSFIGMSNNGQIGGLGLENGDNPSGIIKNKMSCGLPSSQRIASLELPQNSIASDALSCISEIWPWDSQIAPISKQS